MVDMKSKQVIKSVSEEYYYTEWDVHGDCAISVINAGDEFYKHVLFQWHNRILESSGT